MLGSQSHQIESKIASKFFLKDIYVKRVEFSYKLFEKFVRVVKGKQRGCNDYAKKNAA